MRLRVEMSEWSEKDVHVLHDVLMPPKNDTLVLVHVYIHVLYVLFTQMQEWAKISKMQCVWQRWHSLNYGRFYFILILTNDDWTVVENGEKCECWIPFQRESSCFDIWFVQNKFSPLSVQAFQYIHMTHIHVCMCTYNICIYVCMCTT